MAWAEGRCRGIRKKSRRHVDSKSNLFIVLLFFYSDVKHLKKKLFRRFFFYSCADPSKVSCLVQKVSRIHPFLGPNEQWKPIQTAQIF